MTDGALLVIPMRCCTLLMDWCVFDHGPAVFVCCTSYIIILHNSCMLVVLCVLGEKNGSWFRMSGESAVQLYLVYAALAYCCLPAFIQLV